MEIKADVEAIFYFNGYRETSDGYRPAHLIRDDYLTTGLHHYYEDVGENVKRGTITFISPEAYPRSLWIGKTIEMYEGSKNIGYAEIIKIYNPILER